jgi:uncharacterized cupredoxin-like copper-binding protein
MKAAAVALVAVALIALPACGGSSVAQPAGSIKVTMTEYKFDPGDINAPAGKVVFYLVNAGTISHDMVIAKADGTIVTRSDLVSAGDEFVFNVDNIVAGSYKIYCDQPGHADAGMKGTLTIS